MHEPIYVVMVEHEDGDAKNGPAVVQAGEGCHTLECCQTLAWRLENTGHGKASIGLFTPISKSEQIEIGKSQKFKSDSAVLHANNDRKKDRENTDKLKLV